DGSTSPGPRPRRPNHPARVRRSWEQPVELARAAQLLARPGDALLPDPHDMGEADRGDDARDKADHLQRAIGRRLHDVRDRVVDVEREAREHRDLPAARDADAMLQVRELDHGASGTVATRPRSSCRNTISMTTRARIPASAKPRAKPLDRG